VLDLLLEANSVNTMQDSVSQQQREVMMRWHTHAVKKVPRSLHVHRELIQRLWILSQALII